MSASAWSPSVLRPSGTHRYSLPVQRHGKSSLEVPGHPSPVPIHPFFGNAISPGSIPPEGLQGPIIYGGGGELGHLNGKTVEGAIVIMEMASGRNWLHAANLGAKALIYVDRGPTDKMFFEEKLELSPIRFPRFWMPQATARALFGSFETAPGNLTDGPVRLFSEVDLGARRRAEHLHPGAGCRPRAEGRAGHHRDLFRQQRLASGAVTRSRRGLRDRHPAANRPRPEAGPGGAIDSAGGHQRPRAEPGRDARDDLEPRYALKGTERRQKASEKSHCANQKAPEDAQGRRRESGHRRHSSE